ncbi:MAG TPA: GH1 family beta-glucosidase [Ktedonobacteraceae bacterium]
MTTEDKTKEQMDLSQLGQIPADFFWGASTSAYQIEGATREDGRGSSIWDDFAATPGMTYNGETGEIAVDHYHRMEEDVALMKRLGLNAYCFSVAWPRVFPTGRGELNGAGLDFYERLVDTLLAQGITPLLKLYHWDLPSTLQQAGGWLNRDTAYAFADYAECVARRLGDRVSNWVTHNEPWCTSYLGHVLGIHAPGLKDAQLGVYAAHHVLLSHGLAVPRIRANTPVGTKVGVALDYYPVHAYDDSPETKIAVERADAFRNRWFFDPIFKKQYPEGLFTDLGVLPPIEQEGDFEHIGVPVDFLALNYYTRMVVRAPQGQSTQRYEQVQPIPGSPYTAMDWEIYPDGLLETVERINRDYAPPTILVTESGAAFADNWDGKSNVSDLERTHYLNLHIQRIGQAVARGIPMQGYFVWSFLDNYEWAWGYSQRFGIIYVDFLSQKRVIKESGYWYASLIAALRDKQKK